MRKTWRENQADSHFCRNMHTSICIPKQTYLRKIRSITPKLGSILLILVFLCEPFSSLSPSKKRLRLQARLETELQGERSGHAHSGRKRGCCLLLPSHQGKGVGRRQNPQMNSGILGQKHICSHPRGQEQGFVGHPDLEKRWRRNGRYRQRQGQTVSHSLGEKGNHGHHFTFPK